MLKVDSIGQEYCLPCADSLEVEGVIVERDSSCDKCTLEREREIAGAKQDIHGRYYVQDSEGYRSYGYRTHFSGLYVCYTDGHYCECEGE
jgi:hypothetical protein